MYTKRLAHRKTSQHGISLVELIMFIVIVSLGIVGILSVMNVTTKASADPMLRKQAMAIAESLLEEIELQAFTFCDPDDASALTATAAIVGVGGCTDPVQGLGAVGETRYADPRFDNVGDYHGFSMPAGIYDIQNTLVNGLGGYSASVTMVQDGVTFGLAAAEVLRIDVTVTDPGGQDLLLTGYRFRYAPRAVP